MNAVTPSRQRPRGLPLAHWFLLVAATALLLFYLRIAERIESPRDEIDLRKAIEVPVISVVYGPAVAALFLALWNWLRRANGLPDQPGHWLLIAHGCAILTLLWGQVRLRRGAATDWVPGLLVEGDLEAAALAVGAAVLLAGATQQRSDAGWRYLLAGWGAASLAHALINLRYYRVLEWGGQWPAELIVWPAGLLVIDCLALGALLWLVVWRRSRWRLHDAWHHLGIIVSTLAIVLKAVSEIQILSTP